MATYYVTRDWGDEYGYGVKTFSTEDFKTLANVFGEADLGHIVTGLTEDDYADNSSDIVKEYFEDEGSVDSVVYCLAEKRISEDYNTAEAYFRLMNLNLTDEEAKVAWAQSTADNCAS